jgi:hypothetical protein
MIKMGEEEKNGISEKWVLLSSLEGGYQRFPLMELLGLSEYIKNEKEKEETKIKVIIIGGVLGFIPGYITKGAIERVRSLKEGITNFNEAVVATKPHLMRIVDNVDEVYYIPGIEDKNNIKELYSSIYYYFSHEFPNALFNHFDALFEYLIFLEETIDQTRQAKEENESILKVYEEKINKIKKSEAKQKEVNKKKNITLLDFFETKENKDEKKNEELKNLEKEKKKYEKELKNIEKKIELNQQEKEDCEKLLILMKDLLVNWYVEKIRYKNIEVYKKRWNDEFNKLKEKYKGKLQENNILKKLEEAFNEANEKIKEEQNLKEREEMLKKERDELRKKLKETLPESEEFETVQEKLKEVTNKIRAITNQLKEFRPRRATTFEEFTGNKPGESDIGKLIWKIATAEYLFYIKNVFGRRKNVKIILEEFKNLKSPIEVEEMLFESSLNIGNRKVKIRSNLSNSDRYTVSLIKNAIQNVKDEDVSLFLNSYLYIKPVPKKDDTFALLIGVPPLISLERLEEEIHKNIQSKYTRPYLDKRLAVGTVVINFYENGGTSFEFLKPIFLQKLASLKIKKEIDYLEREKEKITKASATNINKIERIHISNKLPSELKKEELIEWTSSGLEDFYRRSIQNIQNKEDEGIFRYFLIGDAHYGYAPSWKVTEPLPQQLFEGVAKIISEELKREEENLKGILNALLFLGDMFEGKNFEDSEILDKQKDFEKWIKDKEISGSLKNDATLAYGYLCSVNKGQRRYEPSQDIMNPFVKLWKKNSTINKIVAIDGNHKPLILEGKATLSEAQFIANQFAKNVPPTSLLIGAGATYGGVKLSIEINNNKVDEIYITHKYKNKYKGGENVFCAHFHEFEANIFNESFKIQNSALANITPYTQQLGIPASNELRGFSEVEVTYIDKKQAKLVIRPFFYKEIIYYTSSTPTKILQKYFGKKGDEIFKLIREFENEIETFSANNLKSTKFEHLLREEETNKNKIKV